MGQFGGLLLVGYGTIKADLAASTREDNPKARDAEWVAFFDRVWRVAMATTQGYVGTDEAADIASDVVVRLWRHRDRYPELMESHSALEAFVVTAARRLMLNRERNRRLRATRESEYVAVQPASTPDAGTEQRLHEMQTLIAQTIAQLPPRAREAWRLVQIEGKSHVDAARAMGVVKQTVNVHLCHALRALRDALDRYQREA